MKIERSCGKTKNPKFADLKPGDACTVCKDGVVVFVKTDGDILNAHGVRCNSVNLNDGKPANFSPNGEVYPLPNGKFCCED